jgi:hypothetical protein
MEYLDLDPIREYLRSFSKNFEDNNKTEADFKNIFRTKSNINNTSNYLPVNIRDSFIGINIINNGYEKCLQLYSYNGGCISLNSLFAIVFIDYPVNAIAKSGSSAGKFYLKGGTTLNYEYLHRADLFCGVRHRIGEYFVADEIEAWYLPFPLREYKTIESVNNSIVKGIFYKLKFIGNKYYNASNSMIEHKQKPELSAYEQLLQFKPILIKL